MILFRVGVQISTRDDAAATRRRHGTPPTPLRDPNVVTVPRDGEVYAYLGPQMRWVQLFLIAAFVLAGASLFVFATAHPLLWPCLLYTSPSPRDRTRSRMPSSA